MRAAVTAVRSLAGRARALLIRCLAGGRTERQARTVIGMPARHPEHLTRELPEADEEWLAALAASLWPADEYTEIITSIRPGDQ